MYIKSLTPYLGKILFFITFTDGKITKHVLFLSISFKIKMISVSNNKIIFTEETPTMLKKCILFIEIGIPKIRSDWNLPGNDI